MNKKLRTVLFSFFVIVFISVAPAILLYSEGYRFDWQQKKILETGGIYIKTNFANASVSIDGKYTNKTAQLSHDYLAQNLLPKEHTVKVEMTGYHSWEKHLEVEKKMVAQVDIVLFPEIINFIKLKDDVQNLFSFSDQNKLLLADKNNQLSSYANSQETILIDATTAAKYYAKITDIKMSPDAKTIIIKAEDKSRKIIYYTASATNVNSTLAVLKNLDKTTTSLFFTGNNTIIFDQAGKIFSEDLSTQKPTPLLNGTSVQAFYIEGESLYFLSKGNLMRQNMLTQNQETISKSPMEIAAKSEYQLLVFGGRTFILKDKISLYGINAAKEFEKLLDSPSEIKYYPLPDKILFATDYELWLLLLKDYQSPFFQKAGSMIFISRFSEKINGIDWVGNDYFAYLLNNKLKISEIDNRDSINSFQVSDNDGTQIWFNKNEKALYFISRNSLFVSPKLIP
ncbi:MAG: PEGA domain-containing protein [Candidatus Paceibacterota bacterium]